MQPLKTFLKHVGIEPKDLSLYELAFTHTSVISENIGIGKDYERLEFIGDACLSMVVADLVFTLHPKFSEGEMSKTRAKFVQTESLVLIAKKLNLVEFITIGPSIQRADVGASKKILENVFEAFVGAIYVDLGYKKAYDFVSNHFRQLIEQVKIEQLTDYKTRLQEEMQAEYREAVSYELILEEGPAHDRIFTVKVMFKDIVLGIGKGSSKKQAEQDAARLALEKKVV
jgi:ribonuclease III